MMFLLFLSFWLSCHSDAYPHIGIIRSEEDNSSSYEDGDNEEDEREPDIGNFPIDPVGSSG